MMLSSKDVSLWLYVMIGASVIVTFLLTNKVLDKLGTPALHQAPKIFSDHPAARNIHHISPNTPQVTNNVHKKISSKISEAIEKERKFLVEDLAGFESVGGDPLSELMMESGGQPVRAMVSTTWRSGSTFLGDIMTSHPGTFYHYEPLLHYDIVQARSGALADDAVRTLRDLMHCNYTNLDRYLSYGKSHQWLFSHNPRLWSHCISEGQSKFRSSYCWSPEFLNRLCPLFPFQSIKTVRLRLNLTRSLVEDPDLNVKVLLLIRDPRGTMQSRKHRVWCPNNPDCEDPAKLCDDLTHDYHAFKTLSADFPGRYKVFRYEDFSMDPYNNTKDVFQFFGFTFHNRVKKFLDSHTRTNIGGVSSTFRDSKTAPFKWREKLSKEEVLNIQSKCDEAMKVWGYKMYDSDSDLNTFEPVMNLENFRIT